MVYPIVTTALVDRRKNAKKLCAATVFFHQVSPSNPPKTCPSGGGHKSAWSSVETCFSNDFSGASATAAVSTSTHLFRSVSGATGERRKRRRPDCTLSKTNPRSSEYSVTCKQHRRWEPAVEPDVKRTGVRRLWGYPYHITSHQGDGPFPPSHLRFIVQAQFIPRHLC